MRSANDGVSELARGCGEGEIVSVETDGEVGDAVVSGIDFSVSNSDGIPTCALSVAA